MRRRIGSEFQINQITLNSEEDPDIAVLSDGRFVVAYTRYVDAAGTDTDVVVQFVNPDGTLDLSSGGDVGVAISSRLEDNAAVAARLDGGFTAVWINNTTPGPNDLYPFPSTVLAQVMSSTGQKIGAPILLFEPLPNASGQNILAPASVDIATMGNGNQVIATEYDGFFALRYLDIQVMAPNGNLFVLDHSSSSLLGYAGLRDDPAVAGGATNALIVFEDYQQNDGYFGIGAVLYNDIGSELTAVRISPRQDYHDPDVAYIGGNRYVVVYDQESGGVFAQIFDAKFNSSGTQIIVSQFAGSARHPHVAATPDGGFVVTWDGIVGSDADDSGLAVLERTFNASGFATSDEFVVNHFTSGDQNEPAVAVSGTNILTAWTDYGAETTDTDPPGIRGQVQSIAASSDYNFDLHSDILWRNDNGSVSIWDNGALGFAHIVSGPGVVPNSWHISGTGDFDGNGKQDILWRNDNGSVSIWDNGAIGGAHIISGPGVVPNTWHISGTGDFDGNGKSDILWRNDNGSVSIWDNGAIGGAHIVSGPGVVSNAWHISGTGDFNNNGKQDILWRNDNGLVSIWDNGAIGFAHIVSGPGVVPNSWHISDTGDFDGNGTEDILWRNDNGSVSIWDNGAIGRAHIISGPGVVPNSWHISGTGDYDGNGKEDILWRNDNGSVSIWDNGAIGGTHIVSGPFVVPSDWHIS